ncbi:type VI secretion protein [Roseomonas xinghualingensis]|uniref:type VI secretion protein n=1 Tax=Roseomonas xinghualingensis TaxID=2986475 RepID=UPI0021F1D341|nr:type VI secretion protein [Roseomonas sp. SXEYE001]MCV4209379.1 type VI secretion protein [Roseomonas sp. SXEYE001]
MRRITLAIVACAVFTSAVAAQRADWQVIDRTDPITDRRQLQVAKLSDRTTEGRRAEGVFVVMCSADEPRLGVVWPGEVAPAGFFEGLNATGAPAVMVTFRVGNSPAEEEPWELFSDRVTTVFQPKEVMHRLLEAKSLTVRAASPAGRQMTLQFNLAGMRQAIRPVLSACKWN